MGILRHLEEPLRQLVLDAALRQPAEDARLPHPAPGRSCVIALRRILFPFHLARARLGAGGERLLLVAVGIVAGSAAIAAVLSGRLVMQDRSLAQATAQLAPSDRSIEVAWLGALSGPWPTLDRQVT